MRYQRLFLSVSAALIGGLCCGCNDQPTVSAQPKPAVVMAAQGDSSSATPEEIQRRCGAAASVRREQTTYTTQSAHLWYPSKQVEIITSQQDMHSPTWTLYGGYKSQNPNDERHYSAMQLGKRMPCMKEWTDAAIHAEENP